MQTGKRKATFNKLNSLARVRADSSGGRDNQTEKRRNLSQVSTNESEQASQPADQPCRSCLAHPKAITKRYDQ
jgi:hypothetical protein